MKSLFDFALAGPAAGFVVSFALLIFGLDKTVATDFTDQSLLPALPIVLLRASALGGSMVEFFLGNGALDSLNPELAVLPLHPFAVAGFSGLLINALALLPLGRKYELIERMSLNTYTLYKNLTDSCTQTPMEAESQCPCWADGAHIWLKALPH